MPKEKKAKKEKKKKEVVVPDTDWTAAPHFKENVCIVYIECCRKCFVFAEQAQLFFDMLCEHFPKHKFQMSVNSIFKLGEDGPREGSFEIRIAQHARLNDELVWSGIKAGPPRRENFSTDYADVWPLIEKILSRKLKLPSVEKVNESTDDLQLEISV